MDTGKEPLLLEKEYKWPLTLEEGPRNLGPGSYMDNNKICYHSGGGHEIHTTVQCTLSSSVYRTFIKVENILGHKRNFNTYKTLGVLRSLSSDPNRIKLVKSSNRKTPGKSQITSHERN